MVIGKIRQNHEGKFCLEDLRQNVSKQTRQTNLQFMKRKSPVNTDSCSLLALIKENNGEVLPGVHAASYIKHFSINGAFSIYVRGQLVAIVVLLSYIVKGIMN